MKKAAVSLLIIASLLISLCACGASVTDFLSYADSAKYTVGGGSVSADEITEITVNWVSGSVRIEGSDTDKITFSEVSSADKATDAIGEATKNQELSESLKMRYRTDGEKLTIQFCKSGLRVRTNAIKDLKKDLTVYLPAGTELKNVKLDVVSSDVFMSDIKADGLDINSVSAKLKLVSCGTPDFKCNTVSGDLEIKDGGEIKKLSVKSVSGDVSVQASALDEISVKTVSGKTSLTAEKPLPGSGIETVSGNIEVNAPGVEKLNIKSVSADTVLALDSFDFILEFKGAASTFEADGILMEKLGEKKYKFKDGAGSVTFESVSGKVKLEER